MGIANYIKAIGRGSEGARAISREEAADLWGQLLDGAVTDLEVGAFCLAMRIKGETPQEMAGFLDATHQRIHRVGPVRRHRGHPQLQRCAQAAGAHPPCWRCCWRARAWACWCMARPPNRAGSWRPMCC